MKTSTDHWLYCPYCKHYNDCTKQVQSMENRNVQHMMKICVSCNTRFNIVLGMMGLSTLDDAIKYAPK